MAAFAFNENAHAGGRGNVRHQAEVDAFLLEERTLFNVQLDESGETAGGQNDGFESAREPGGGAQFFEAAALLVAESAAPAPA